MVIRYSMSGLAKASLTLDGYMMVGLSLVSSGLVCRQIDKFEAIGHVTNEVSITWQVDGRERKELRSHIRRVLVVV